MLGTESAFASAGHSAGWDASSLGPPWPPHTDGFNGACGHFWCFSAGSWGINTPSLASKPNFVPWSLAFAGSDPASSRSGVYCDRCLNRGDARCRIGKRVHGAENEFQPTERCCTC